MKSQTLVNIGILALGAMLFYKLKGFASGAAEVRDAATENVLDFFMRPNLNPGANYPISDGRTRKAWPAEKVLPMGWHPDGTFAESHYDVGTNVFHASPQGGKGIVGPYPQNYGK